MVYISTKAEIFDKKSMEPNGIASKFELILLTFLSM